MEQEIPEGTTQNNEEENNQICLAFAITYTGQRTLNCAVYNKNKRALFVTQFNDNEYFSALEGFLIQLNPKDFETEFRVYYDKPELLTESAKLDQLMEGNQTGKLSLAPSKKKVNYEQSLEFLLAPPLNNYFIHTNNSANMNILMRLVSELKLENDETNKGKLKLDTINLSQYMKLDQAAILALQIFPKSQQKKVLSSNQTLFELLCKCKTSIGTRCLKRWMKQPLQDKAEIEKRLDYIEYFNNNAEMRTYVQNQLLNSVGDLEKLYFTFYKIASDKPSRTSIHDLIRILKVVKALEAFMRKLEKRGMTDFERTNIYNLLSDSVETLSKPVTMIQKNVVMEGKESEYYIKPSTQQSLSKISQNKKSCIQEIEEQFERVKDDLGIEMQLSKTENTAQLYLFEGLKEQVTDALKQKKDYKQGTIRGKKMTFKSNRLASLCGELNKHEAEYVEEQKNVIQKMFKAIATYYEVLETVSEVLSALDIYTSWALIISSQSLLPWTRPDFGKDIKAKDMRHPCVANCVPSDLQLVGKNRSAIITGPNMGGKSTFIRMVGISVYLAHIGFFVPAKSFETPLIDAIITRVGASDAQLQGVSTFMNEMLQSSCALKSATDKSLVLIDELGRGTSTHEGFGIAWGICEYLHTIIHSYCLFATHFHQLTKMSDEVEGVINLHAQCQVTKDNIVMNYKVVPGKARMSYGIQLIKSMKFQDSVLEYAEKFYEGLQNFENNSPRKSPLKAKKNTDEVPYAVKVKIIQQTEAMIRNGSSQKEVSAYVKRELGL